MSSSFDMSDMEDFEKDLLKLASQTMPKESKKFLKDQAKVLAKRAKLIIASEGVREKTGNYKKGFKAGKVYTKNGALSCRCYNSSPHAHLIEYGHVQKTKNGEIFVKGRHVLEKANERFEKGYSEAVNKFIDDTLEKGLAR